MRWETAHHRFSGSPPREGLPGGSRPASSVAQSGDGGGGGGGGGGGVGGTVVAKAGARRDPSELSVLSSGVLSPQDDRLARRSLLHLHAAQASQQDP